MQYIILLFIIITVSQILLYKNPRKNLIFILNMALGIYIYYLSYNTMDKTFIFDRLVSLALAFLSLVALIIRFKNIKNIPLSNILISISIIIGSIKLFY